MMDETTDLVGEAIGGAWNIQGGRRVYPLFLGTSDVDGIKPALDEAGLIVVRRRWYHSIFRAIRCSMKS